MRRSNSKKAVVLAVILLLLTSFLTAKQYLGRYALVRVEAPFLLDPIKMHIADTPAIKLGGTGGISFDQVALPASSLVVNSLELHYQDEHEDGQRLLLRINDKEVNLPEDLYDWVLIPTAKYADSKYFGVFTLFGYLMDKEQENVVLQNDGQILNYHPAFDQTLLGLRHLQMDILFLYLDSIALPTVDGEYVLGAGENSPDMADIIWNMEALLDVLNLVGSIDQELSLTFRSYIITDLTREMIFDVSDDILQMDAQPYYFCWRFKQDRPDYNIIMEALKILDNIYDEYLRERDKFPDLQYREWLLDRSVDALRTYELNYVQVFLGTVAEAVSLTTDQERKEFIDLYTTESIEFILVDLLVEMDGQTVDYLQEYSDRLSARTDLLRGVNPLVWDATVSTMRYSAFFRFCKQNFPQQWQEFLLEIENVVIDPPIEIPTVMYVEGNEAIEVILAMHNAESLQRNNSGSPSQTFEQSLWDTKTMSHENPTLIHAIKSVLPEKRIPLKYSGHIHKQDD